MNKICGHFHECGGCRSQDVRYARQLEEKMSRIKELVSCSDFNPEVRPINYYPEWFYRNKMEFTFSPSEGNKGFKVGLHSKVKKREVVDLSECLIFSQELPGLLGAVKESLGKHKAYNKFSHRGFLRHLIIRETKFTGELMIGLVTTTEEKLDQDTFLSHLFSLPCKDRIKSVYWILNDSFGDAVVFEKKRLIWGEPFITERLSDLNFRIFIDSFFQTNPAAIVSLYRKIQDYAGLKGRESVLDLYCGVGSIGFFLAGKARSVLGVELKKEIVDNARENAGLNGIDNISFVCSDVRPFLGQNDIGGFDLVILNPPRCGLTNKVKERINKAAPPKIFYSSCNPKTLFEDLNVLSAKYEVEFIEPFDFFPHTPHMECLTLLNRKQFSLDKITALT